MVGVAQLVERRVVVADVAGSSPVVHPKMVSQDMNPNGSFVRMVHDLWAT